MLSKTFQFKPLTSIFRWRSFSNERKVAPAKGFIDGNLVESFLELSEDQMLRVAQELDMALEEVVRKIETLSRAIH